MSDPSSRSGARSSVSLVVASFNQPRGLRLVFEGVLALRDTPDEFLVADDGSESDIAESVREFSRKMQFPVHFLWQENRGFRKAKALNNSLRRAKGDLVLFLDGDTVPHVDWLTEHVRALEAGADYATGGYVYLDMAHAEALVAGARPEQFLTKAERRRLRRIHRRNRWHRVVRTSDKPKILGGNWSATRTALRNVNGFDERYEGFGKEDSDIRNRLNSAGLHGVSLWNRAFVYHCPHELDPRRLFPSDARRAPDREYYESRKNRSRCSQGIVYTKP